MGLILVRHGQTAANADGLLLGRSDPPLTDLGRRQAEALAAALPAGARVVSSPLRRARETAAALGRPVEVDDRWVELDYGDFEGLAVGEVAGEVWDRWRDDTGFAPPGGESLASVGERVRRACADLVDEARAGEVVVVSHVSPIKAAVAWALGVADSVAWRLYLDECGVSRIGFGRNGPVLRTFNQCHPPPPPPP